MLHMTKVSLEVSREKRSSVDILGSENLAKTVKRRIVGGAHTDKQRMKLKKRVGAGHVGVAALLSTNILRMFSPEFTVNADLTGL